jgi:hypothetical protein
MTLWRQLSLLKGPRQRGVKPPPATEFKTQCALARTIRIGLEPGWKWNVFPSGEKRTPATGARLKAMGHQPGWFDLIFIGPDGVHHWLELKRGRQALTEAQRQFQIDMNMRGVPCAVARSYEAALEQLKAWGAIRVAVAA